MVGGAADRAWRAAGALILCAGVFRLLLLGSDASAQEFREQRPSIVGAVTVYTVRSGDTLRSIGGEHGTSVAALTLDNELVAGAALAVGQQLRVDNRHIVPPSLEAGTLVINIPQRMLFYGVDDDGVGVEGYPVAVGRRGWRTPANEFAVVAKERHPTWDVPVSILEESLRKGRVQPPRVPPGPDNPLGEFWIGLSLPGIGIHGTNAPSSIFGASTHGCIRMHPGHIERLFPRVSIGTRGRTIYEPVLMATQGRDVYLEVHPDIYQRGAVGARDGARDVARALAREAGLSERIDWRAADDVAALRDGIAREVTLAGSRR